MQKDVFTQKNRYDAEGYRYEAEENGTVNRFVYHEGMPLAELDEENMPKAGQYLGNGFLGGRLRKKKDSVPLTVPQTDEKDRTPTIPTISTIPTVPSKPELCYYIEDEQGSIRYVIGEDGTVGNRYRYDAFGVPEETEEVYDNRLRYNGQIYDELTEQYYLRARYYQPQLGRFTQEDLLFADGLNLYAYCGNNPVMYSDPSGLTKGIDCKIKSQAENGNNKGGSYSDDVIQYEKLKSRYVADEIYNAERVGSALKDDPTHRAASYLSKNQLANGRTYSFTGGDNKSYTLLQTKSQLDGVDGIFEYVTNDIGQVTHQRFVKGGIYTGFPNQSVPRGGY